MRLPVDTQDFKFLAVSPPQRLLDFETKEPKADTDGQPLYRMQICAITAEGSEIITVRIAGNPSHATPGEFLNVQGLIANSWSNNGRNGLSFRADTISSAKQQPTAS